MCDDAICLPFIFICGCDKQRSQEGTEAHICPRCHNGTVFATKERNCFTLCASAASPNSKRPANSGTHGRMPLAAAASQSFRSALSICGSARLAVRQSL